MKHQVGKALLLALAAAAACPVHSHHVHARYILDFESDESPGPAVVDGGAAYVHP